MSKLLLQEKPSAAFLSTEKEEQEKLWGKQVWGSRKVRVNRGAASCYNTEGVQRRAPIEKKLNKASKEVMRVTALCSRTPSENWHIYKYLHLKPEENCPRISLETPRGTGNPGRLHSQQQQPKEEGGRGTPHCQNPCGAPHCQNPTAAVFRLCLPPCWHEDQAALIVPNSCENCVSLSRHCCSSRADTKAKALSKA